MKSYNFLFWAYNVIWIGLGVYVGLLLVRLNRTRRRVERLEQRVDELSRD